MENNNEIQKPNFRWPRIGSVVHRNANYGIVVQRLHYTADSRQSMMIHVEEIIMRGNAARAVNVAGIFRITELVMQ